MLPPTVEILSPSSDIQYPATTVAANFDFKFNVNDDIELSKVDISLDGSLLKSYSSFIDYRGMSGVYTYPDLAIGAHTFEVVATDLSGKSTTKSFAFNITKYDKVLESETLYVPFNAGGDYKDLINFVSPTVTGSPGTTSATLVILAPLIRELRMLTFHFPLQAYIARRESVFLFGIN